MGQDFFDTHIREKERAQIKWFVQGHIVELSVHLVVALILPNASSRGGSVQSKLLLLLDLRIFSLGAEKKFNIKQRMFY